MCCLSPGAIITYFFTYRNLLSFDLLKYLRWLGVVPSDPFVGNPLNNPTTFLCVYHITIYFGPVHHSLKQTIDY